MTVGWNSLATSIAAAGVRTETKLMSGEVASIRCIDSPTMA